MPYLLVCWLKSIVLSPIGPYIDGVVWTLVVEAFFYATVLLALLTLRGSSLDRLRTTIGFVSVLYLVALSWARWNEADPTAAHLVALFDRFFFKFFMLQHGVFFALGMAFWSWNHHGRPTSRLPAMIIFALFGCVEIIASSRNPAFATFVTLTIWVLAMVWLIASVCGHTRVSAVLLPHRRLVGDLGRLSYTLYLTHYAFGMCCASAMFALHMSVVPAFVASIAIVSAVSWFVMAKPERFLQAALKPRLDPVGQLLAGRFRIGAVGKG